jgi:TatD DNase family protein
VLVDTHCHVHFNAYKDDMDEVIRRTLSKGVFMITVGTQTTTSANGLKVAERYDGVWATVGLHPNHLCEQEFVDEQELGNGLDGSNGLKGFKAKIQTRCETFDHSYYLDLARHPKCVAIGECGLDYYRLPENVDRDELIAKQKQTVRAHFDLAHEVGLPVVIHCRDAHADQLAIIREYVAAEKLQRRGVVHCFTGTMEEARSYVELGFLISFTGVITFPPKKQKTPSPLTPLTPMTPSTPLQHVVRDLPLEYIMVETDAPYLTPVPHRGERNEPWMVEFVAAKIAELKGVDVEEVARVTSLNAARLFGINL